MSAQLPLRLPMRPALGREAFLVGPSNERALAMIEMWRDWPAGKLSLSGPEGAGKTHLAHVWAELSGAVICTSVTLPAPEALKAGTCLAVEDVDRALPLDEATERRFFHVHNRVLELGGHLLLTGRAAPSKWAIMLPDLASRLSAVANVALEAPDDALLAGVLVKLFADRRIRVEPPVVSYLARRIGRSVSDAVQVVDAIDRAALEKGSEVRIPLARKVLDACGQV